MYSLEMFCKDVELGREIEFRVKGVPFFLGRTQKADSLEIEIENVRQRKTVFIGTMDELLLFPFLGKYQIRNDFSVFDVDCIY